MGNRRDFLKAGLATLALPIAGRDGFSAPASAWTEPAPLPFYKVIFDERFLPCRAFAGEAARWGAPIQAISGDVTSLWFEDLCRRWQDGPAAIAGLTEHGAIFCLERLAWDQQLMRVAYRGEHRRRGDGQYEHTLRGSGHILRDVSGAGEDWGGEIARLMTRFPSGRSGMETTRMFTSSLDTVDTAGHLVSWVIAPRYSA